MKRIRGTTLVELMVVVAIMTILMSLSFAGFLQMVRNARTLGLMRDLKTAAGSARQMARTGNQPVRLVVGTVERFGQTVMRARWERLACTDRWAYNCPSTACRDNACGVGGCICTDVGPDIDIPSGTDVSSLNGLCFLGATSQPRKRTTAGYCLPQSPAPDAGDLKLTVGGKARFVLSLEPLTGMSKLVPCNSQGVCP